MLTHYRVKRRCSKVQIVTLRSDYQYQIAYLRIINSTKDTMEFNNFCGIKPFTLKKQTTK